MIVTRFERLQHVVVGRPSWVSISFVERVHVCVFVCVCVQVTTVYYMRNSKLLVAVDVLQI